MAIRKVNQDSATAWNVKTFFPDDNYILRCIGEDHGVSSTGNPMTTLEWEIVNCPAKQIGDSLVEFDGTKFKSYHVAKVIGDEEKSYKAFKRFQDQFLIPCQIDVTDGWDDENPPSLLGKVVHALVKGDMQTSCSAPTPEERAQGKKVGKPIKDPITGKEVVIYSPKLSVIYGLYEGEVNRKF